MKYFVDGANTSDGSNDENNAMDDKQPLITIFISGRAVPTNTQRAPVAFNLQTSVSARELDNQ